MIRRVRLKLQQSNNHVIRDERLEFQQSKGGIFRHTRWELYHHNSLRFRKHIVHNVLAIFFCSLCVFTFWRCSHRSFDSIDINTSKFQQSVPVVLDVSKVEHGQKQQQQQQQQIGDMKAEVNLGKRGHYDVRKVVEARLGMLSVDMDELYKHRNETYVSIVISHCDDNLYWTNHYISNKYKIRDITIYSKCGKEVKGLQKVMELGPTKVVKLPNVGRCDHSYAYWINEHYHETINGKHLDDVVVFMKDTHRFRTLYRKMDDIFFHAIESGFACVKRPECDCSTPCRKGNQFPTMMHDKDYLFDFSLDKYARLERDQNHEFFNHKFSSLNQWVDGMGIQSPDSISTPVCYLGLFAFKQRQILNQSKETWQKIVENLSRGDNIIEGHYAERMWASMLSDNSLESAKEVDKALLPVVKGMVMRPDDGTVCGMASMYYVRREESYKHYFKVITKDSSNS